MISILIPKFSDKNYGGNAYVEAVINSLADTCKIDTIRLYDNSSLLKTALRFIPALFRLKLTRSGLMLLDQSTIFFHSWLSNNAILIVHHIDWAQSQWLSALIQWLSYQVMLFHKNKWKKIIVVSEFWKDFLERKGFKGVEIIYNAIDPGISQLTLLSKQAFFEKYSLPVGNMIYLGNAQKGKGWRDVYERLKSHDYTFVISGQHDKNIQSLPANVRHLNLPYPDYLAMLRHAEAAVLFSRFQEGWNRTAHECILMGTPVIGSRSGGMSELLEKCGQTICEDINDIEKILKSVLNLKIEKTFKEGAFLRQFDELYFKTAWTRVVHSFEQ